MRNCLLCSNDFERLKEGKNLRETRWVSGWPGYSHAPRQENFIDYRFATSRILSLPFMVVVPVTMAVIRRLLGVFTTIGVGMLVRVPGGKSLEQAKIGSGKQRQQCRAC